MVIITNSSSITTVDLELVTRVNPISKLLIPVVGGSPLVRDGGVVDSPGVEPLELPVLVVGKQFSGIFLLAPVHISGLTGQSVTENIRVFFTLFVDLRC